MRVSAILSVVTKEFRENLRDRRTVLSALIIGPLFGPVLFSGALSLSLDRGVAQAENPVALAVAHAERAPNLLRDLRQHGVVVEQVDFDDAAARAAVKEHIKPLVLYIPEDFDKRLRSSDPAQLLLYVDTSDAATGRDASRISGLLERYASIIARLRIMARGIDPLVLSPIIVHDVDVSTPASRSVVMLGMLSYLMLLTMLMGGMYLAIDATAGERERGSLEPLLTVPVRREDLIYGKMLATSAYMALSLTLTTAAFAVMLQFIGLERFGMTVNFGPAVALRLIVMCLPLIPVGAALMTIVAAFTRSYREAQTYLGLLLLVPTLPLVFANLLGWRPTPSLMAVPSLSQHFLITSLLRDEPLPAKYLLISVVATLAIGAMLMRVAGQLYQREALLG